MKKVMLALVLVGMFSTFHHVAFAQVVDPNTATSTESHSGGGNQPVYFFKQIGRLTNTQWLTDFDSAEATTAWKVPAIQAKVLDIWRQVVFGYPQGTQI